MSSSNARAPIATEGEHFCLGAHLSRRSHRALWLELLSRLQMVEATGPASDRTFEYHNDPEKTASVFNERGWSSLGDVGYLDEDGYLYLTDRISHMIISGGVNIHPQEVESLLTLHPEVVDVAVIGVPDRDMGEEVKAVVIPATRPSPTRVSRRRSPPIAETTSPATSAPHG